MNRLVHRIVHRNRALLLAGEGRPLPPSLDGCPGCLRDYRFAAAVTAARRAMPLPEPGAPSTGSTAVLDRIAGDAIPVGPRFSPGWVLAPAAAAAILLGVVMAIDSPMRTAIIPPSPAGNLAAADSVDSLFSDLAADDPFTTLGTVDYLFGDAAPANGDLPG